MADRREFVFEDIRISSNAIDWRRRVPVLRRVLSRWPYFTGKWLKFRITAEPVTEEAKHHEIELQWQIAIGGGGPILRRGGTTQNRIAMDEAKHWTTDTAWLGEDRRHGLSVDLAVYKADGTQASTSGFLEMFDVKSSDTLALSIGVVVLSVVLSFLSSWFVSLQQDSISEPLQVIVVEPTPASQSETGSNEP